MILKMLEFLYAFVGIINLGIMLCLLRSYLKFKESRIYKIIMELDELLETQNETMTKQHRENQHRDRLVVLAAGGQLGKHTAEQVDAMDDTEIEKIYAQYETRLGAQMTKTLGQSALQLYAMVAGKVLPITDESLLVQDLENDPFVQHALSSAACELYYRFGMYLAPLTAALTTARHCSWQCRFEENKNDYKNIEHNDDKNGHGSGNESGHESEGS